MGIPKHHSASRHPVMKSRFSTDSLRNVLDLRKCKPKKSPAKRHAFVPRDRDYILNVPLLKKTIRPLQKVIPKIALLREQKKALFPKSLRKKEIVRLAAIGVAIVMFFNIFNVYYRAHDLKNTLVYSANEGFLKLLSAGMKTKSNNAEQARLFFADAFDDFDAAEREIRFLQSASQYFPAQGEGHAMANNILKSGKHLASAGDYFAQSLEGFQHLFSVFLSGNVIQPSLTDQFKDHFTKILGAVQELEIAHEYLSQIHEYLLPESIRPQFSYAKSQITTLIQAIEHFNRYLPALLKILGDRYPHRILVLLQNNNEIRPTGGFIGSFLIVDVNDGKISGSFHDVYDFDGQLHEYIPTPLPISNLTDSWRMRDANSSPDFPVSAEKIMWFLEKEKGPGVDSVIAVDLAFARSLLELTGPITVEGITFHSENFDMLLSYIVESKLSGITTPKKILDSFIPAVQEKFLSEMNSSRFFPVLINVIREKHVQAYSQDEEIQRFFRDFGLAGEISDDSTDFFGVIHSSIGGNKSDRFISQEITHRTFIQGNGDIVNQATIRRTHTWNKETELRLRREISDAGFDEPSDFLMNILGAGENVTGMQIYVPEGSELIEISGDRYLQDVEDRSFATVHLNEDSGLTYFYATMSIAPGDTEELTLTYRLPKQLSIDLIDEYELNVLKQAGSKNDTFLKELHVSPHLQTYRVSGEFEKIADGFFQYEGTLDRDMRFAGLFGGR